jgi:hypothetical protein
LPAPGYPNFERGHFYPIGALREAEADLLSVRKADRQLSAMWRAPTGKHARSINLRNTELYPLKAFADHKGFPDAIRFRLSQAGDAADAQIEQSSGLLNLQITVANLDWDGGESSNPGFQHRLEMESLNSKDVLSGHGPFRRALDGRILGQESVYSDQDRLDACRRGLQKALQRKATHDGRGFDLLIYTRAFYIQTIDSEYELVARSVVERHGRPKFDHVHIFDEPQGCYVEI